MQEAETAQPERALRTDPAPPLVVPTDEEVAGMTNEERVLANLRLTGDIANLLIGVNQRVLRIERELDPGEVQDKRTLAQQVDTLRASMASLDAKLDRNGGWLHGRVEDLETFRAAHEAEHERNRVQAMGGE